MDREAFPQRLKKLRKEKGLTQAELAEELGVAMNTVSIWELGKRMPDDKTIEKIARYFVTPVNYLLGLSEFGDLDSLMSEVLRIKRLQGYADDTDQLVAMELSAPERQVIDMYRDLSTEGQEQLLAIVKIAYLMEKDNGKLQSQKNGKD